MSTQTTFLIGLASRIQDAENKLAAADRIDCLNAAISEYSLQRPQVLTAEVSGDGTAFVALPEDWEPQFSEIVRLDWLDDDGQPTLVPPSDYQVITNPPPESDVLFMVAASPVLADTVLRLQYSLRHSVTASASTIPTCDEAAVCDLAASYALLRLAAAYAQSTDPQIATVTLDYRSKVGEYRQLATNYREQYRAAMSSGGKAAGGRMIYWHPDRTKLFH